MFGKKPTEKQLNANRENAQSSSGPRTEEGKNHSKLNNFRHGLAGHTMVHVLLDWESEADFARLEQALWDEHQPETTTEKLLVGKMAQHYWLAQRAITIQSMAMHAGPFAPGAEGRVTTYIRYQAQHERAFRQALADLLKLRSEKRKQEIGFESEKRKDAKESRTVELHRYAVARAESKFDRYIVGKNNAPKPEGVPIAA